MKDKLLVLQKLEDWMILIYPNLQKLPKAMRFTLAQRIENTSLECIEFVIAANFEKTLRQNHILKARVCVGKVQVLIRTCYGLGLINISHYELYSERLLEISKMLTGWARVSQ